MAELNYGMFEDVNNGICINKPLDFYTYEKLEIDEIEREIK
jgi:hypothetical protein